jgi:hypothetical protein
MNKEELDCMKNEYEIGLKAIETVTEKLISLAVVENKFIEQVESIKLLNVKFEGIFHSSIFFVVIDCRIFRNLIYSCLHFLI